ncbi:hypothetical protein ACEWY4_023423 [Coilia grayii]|uniref:MAP2/Tau projection domain-containing protein n=1 Tax=Coilia grayii TaxID=363190 RepID=A0ABD1J5K3_9TELE
MTEKSTPSYSSSSSNSPLLCSSETAVFLFYLSPTLSSFFPLFLFLLEVEDSANLPPSPPPSPAAEHFGPLEPALKMDADRPGHERTAPTGVDFTELERQLASVQAAPSNGQSHAKETPKVSTQIADSLSEQKCVTKQLSVEATEQASSKAATTSHKEKKEDEESWAFGVKHTAATVSVQSSEMSLRKSSEVKVKDEKHGEHVKDKSGMSAYFETTALKEDEGRVGGEGYYELSTAAGGEKKGTPEISYTNLGENKAEEDGKKSASEEQSTLPPIERRDDCRLSPGKLALDQRSYSLNIPIGGLDQARPRIFSPLATDILSFTSGSLDESADYLPVTTPSVEKLPQFPPVGVETSASDAPSSSPPAATGSSGKTSPQRDSPPELSFPTKYQYKNGTVMAPDLPEMLDLAGTRSRLTSENTDPDIMRRKSVPADVSAHVTESLAHLILGDQGQKAARSESQLEELGYCVFSEYSGPMPSPADVYSPMDSMPQIFTTMPSEEKDAAPGESSSESAPAKKNETPPDSAISSKDEDVKLGPAVGASTEKDMPDTKDSKGEEADAKTAEMKVQAVPEVDKTQSNKQAETFVTPMVTVTLEEAKPDKDAEGSTSDAEEIAAYERQIRKLEMEDRPLSVEEERELQELREKVKNKPDLVHQEAYEEVDAEDVYQLTGVAKDRIARPIRPSPASSVESAPEEEKPSPTAVRPIQLEGAEAPVAAAIRASTPEPAEKVTKEEEKPSSPEPKPGVSEPSEKTLAEVKTQPVVTAPEATVTMPAVPQKEEDEMEMGEEIELAEEPEEFMAEVKPETPVAKSAPELPGTAEEGKPREEEEALEGAEAAAEKAAEPRAAIESVVTVEDDFITVVQTIDEGEEPVHSVRFSAPPQEEPAAQAAQRLQEADEEEEEEEEESVEMAQEVEMEAASLEEVPDVPEVAEPPVLPLTQPEVAIESEIAPESYDDYKDETTIDDSILDSSWVDTQDEDKSMATEKIEPLPKVRSPVKKPAVVEKPVKQKAKGGRVKGRVSTPERKPVRKEPLPIPREDTRKKKAVIKKAEFPKKSEIQTRSPSRKSALKPAVRHPRPAQHHACVKRRPTVSADGRQPMSVARHSRDRTSDGGSRSPEKRSSLPRPASILSRRYHPAEPEESSTSITSSGSTAPRRPTSFRTEFRAEYRTGRAHSVAGRTETSRSESARSRSARSGTSTPRTPGSTAITPGTPPSYSSCRTPGTPGTPRTPKSLSLLSGEKKVAIIRTPPKSPATTPKQLRIINQPLPDLRNVKSKIGSIDNIKYQPKGGQVSPAAAAAAARVVAGAKHGCSHCLLFLLSLSLSVFLCLSVSLSLSLSLCLSLSMSLSLCLPVCLTLSRCLSLSAAKAVAPT